MGDIQRHDARPFLVAPEGSKAARTMAEQTEIERLTRLIEQTHARVTDAEELARDTHRRLFDPQREGEASFMARAEDAIKAFEHGSWASKILIRIVLTAGAIAAALTALKTYAQDIIKG